MKTKPRNRQSHAGRSTAVVTALHAFTLLLLWAGENLVGERTWLTTLLTYAPQHPWLAMPAVLTLWSMVRRQWRFAALNALLGLIAAVALVGYNIPLSLRTGAGQSLRIMTFNIHAGLPDLDEIAETISDQRPDVVCLQEAVQYRSPQDPVPPLQRRLPDYHVVRHGEMAFMSRYPIVSTRIHDNPVPLRRIIMENRILVSGREVAVCNVHFATAAHPRLLLRSMLRRPSSAPAFLEETAAVRERQTQVLLEACASIDGPLIVAGDFNTPPRGLIYRRLRRHLTDAFRAAGWGTGYTFRTDTPVLRIDYVWAGPGLTIKSCFVPNRSGSDHMPVVAEVMLP